MAAKNTHHTSHAVPPTADPWWVGAGQTALLAAMLAIAALRATFTETPHTEGLWRAGPLSSEAKSLLISLAVIAAAALWLIAAAFRGRLLWRRTFFGAATGVFCLIGLAGAAAASDKRAALTDWLVLMSGPVAGLLAVQLFDRREKVRLFLWLLLAVAAAATYACYDKMTSSADMLIDQYEKNPEAFLVTLGIEPGSLEHWQYEHRLYSRDVSGFLTTSNSTGSFFLLAVFAGVGLCIEAFAARRGSEETLVAMLCTALAAAIALAGLLMTQSKGAIGSFILLLPVLCGVLLFRRALWAHRRKVCAALLVAAATATAAMTAYGVRHGRLPGGNSMLVRWQYWEASARMAGDMPLLGTGGGNYATHYLKYKEPAAPETISDPHNWLVSLLCRFGVVGLAAMGAALLRPTGRLFERALSATDLSDPSGPPYGERFIGLTLLAAVMAIMVLIRPAVFHLDEPGATAMEQSAAFLVLVVIPAGIVALVFGLLRFAGAGDASFRGPNIRLTAALACGLAAVLLHNLVDFALFEPGVWTLFWLTAAAGVALTHLHEPDGGAVRLTFRTTRQKAMAAVVPPAVLAVAAVCVVIPPLRRGVLVFEAIRAVSSEQATERLDRAVAADRLSPDAAVTAARLLLHRFGQRTAAQETALLDRARGFAETAVARAPADPRPRRLLAEILLTAAAFGDHPAQTRALQEDAYAVLLEAVARYPGSDMLNYRLGVLAQELGRDDEAIRYLERALDIETAYRAQFRVMYPQDDVVSRLGPKAYAELAERLKQLTAQEPNSPERD